MLLTLTGELDNNNNNNNNNNNTLLIHSKAIRGGTMRAKYDNKD